ncbi:MAG: hypothetical protein K2H61_04435 [Muribaculaceae bacterium]|nr:hypothetical protein [Muribaculaceae bacterium]
MTLKMTPRTYFDSCCHEYSTYPIEEKLLDIGFATVNGHNIMDDINYILDNYSYVSEHDIQRALWKMMAYLSDVDSGFYYHFDRNNSLATDAALLIEDLMRRFRLPGGDRRKAFLADDF